MWPWTRSKSVLTLECKNRVRESMLSNPKQSICQHATMQNLWRFNVQQKIWQWCQSLEISLVQKQNKLN